MHTDLSNARCEFQYNYEVSSSFEDFNHGGHGCPYSQSVFLPSATRPSFLLSQLKGVNQICYSLRQVLMGVTIWFESVVINWFIRQHTNCRTGNGLYSDQCCKYTNSRHQFKCKTICLSKCLFPLSAISFQSDCHHSVSSDRQLKSSKITLQTSDKSARTTQRKSCSYPRKLFV